MSKKIFEDQGGPHLGHAAGDTDIEKQASQLASDVKYKVKKTMSGVTRMTPAQVSQAYLQQLSKSPAPAIVKALAKKKLMGKLNEQFTADDIIENSLVSAFEKVFMHKVDDSELVQNDEYLMQLEETGERKYKVRVTDKKTGNSYIRYATRPKISELRANPNISSVEMTEYGQPYETERTKGARTAAVKSGKDYDEDGKVESGAKEYRGVVHNAIQRKKGGVADGKDTSGVREEFISEIDKKEKKNEIDVMSGKNTCVKLFPESEVREHTQLVEKSSSVNQQQAAGAALSAKRGKIDPSELKGASLEMYKTMTEKQLRDFAKTKHKGLPEKVEEETCSTKGGEDTRGDYAKVNLIKNKLRAMGAKNPIVMVASEETVDEGMGLSIGASKVLGKVFSNKRTSEAEATKSAQKNITDPVGFAIKGKSSGTSSDQMVNKRRPQTDLQKRVAAKTQQVVNQSYELDGNVISEREFDEPGEEDWRPDVRAHNKAVGYRGGYKPYGKRPKPGNSGPGSQAKPAN
jgi:hypothetical protein